MDVHSGETLLFDGHPSWRSILGFYLTGVALGLVAAVIARLVTGDWLWAVVTFAVAESLTVLAGLVKRIGTEYTISDQRLRIKRGILSRAVQECRLERVQNVNTEQSFLQRLLGYGTVDFDTAGSDDSDFSFVGVDDPEAIAARVDRAMRGGPEPSPVA